MRYIFVFTAFKAHCLLGTARVSLGLYYTMDSHRPGICLFVVLTIECGMIVLPMLDDSQISENMLAMADLKTYKRSWEQLH